MKEIEHFRRLGALSEAAATAREFGLNRDDETPDYAGAPALATRLFCGHKSKRAIVLDQVAIRPQDRPGARLTKAAFRIFQASDAPGRGERQLCHCQWHNYGLGSGGGGIGRLEGGRRSGSGPTITRPGSSVDWTGR